MPLIRFAVGCHESASSSAFWVAPFRQDAQTETISLAGGSACRDVKIPVGPGWAVRTPKYPYELAGKILLLAG
jgi:hypothetical protein